MELAIGLFMLVTAAVFIAVVYDIFDRKFSFEFTPAPWITRTLAWLSVVAYAAYKWPAKVAYRFMHDEEFLAKVVVGAVILALLLIAMTYSRPAQAHDMHCLPNLAYMERFLSDYDEERVWSSVAPETYVYSNPDGSSWTYVVVLIDNRVCIAFEGSEWVPGTPS